MTRERAPCNVWRTNRRVVDERGIVLFIALIALVAMSLASAAVVRSMDTTVSLAGNVALRGVSIAAADAGVEAAVAAIANRSFDTDRDAAALGYYASRQAGEDVRGIPYVLQQRSRYPAGAPILDAGSGYGVRYVIERLCATDGAATEAHCNMVTSPATSAPGSPPPLSHATFRITIRVDGPQSAVSHVQVMLRDSTPQKRMSWLLVGE